MKNLLYILLAAILVFSVSCSEDNPSEPHEEHFEASGLVLIKSGDRFFRVFNGEITSDTKVLEVPFEDLTDHYEVMFLDENGDDLAPPTDEDFALVIIAEDPTITEMFQDEPGEWEFHLRGLAKGTTNIEIKVKHIDHFGFTTPKIPVEVK